MLIMPLLNRATVTYVIHMLYKRCTQRKQPGKADKIDVGKDVRGPQEGDPQSVRFKTLHGQLIQGDECLQPF